MRTNIALPIRKFFEQYLVEERGASPHTVLAYRDTWKLLLQFLTDRAHIACTELTVEDLTAERVRQFLTHLERDRHTTVRTRNARLAAIHSFVRYLASLDPRWLSRCQDVLAIRFKRQACPVQGYLEREEVVHIFRHIDGRTPSGARDDAVLRLLYNTGARAQELVDVDVSHVRFSRPALVRIHGKGQKERTCPLWPETIRALKTYLEGRGVRLSDNVPLFVNARGQRLSRFGLRYLVAHRVAQAAKTAPTLLTRTIGPHTFRHTTAMHLLQSGVDLNMIRSWLGHASIETTHGYVELDLDMKRKVLQATDQWLPRSTTTWPSWQKDPGILAWLSQL
jgi:site-specific recombinase XerD